REIVAAAGDARLGVHARPARAGVVRAVDAGGASGGDPRVQAARIARRNPEPDAAETVGRAGQAACEGLPGIAAIGRLEQPAGRPRIRVVVLPGTLTRGPQRSVDGLCVRRIERNIDRSGVLVLVEHLPESAAAA